MKQIQLLIFSALVWMSCRPLPEAQTSNLQMDNKQEIKHTPMKTEEEWKQVLNPEQYSVLREKGTERAFTGEYWNHHEKGQYHCAGCGAPLFESSSKFDSGCGWPSYFKPAQDSAVTEHLDKSHGMIRTEVTCSKCGGHLGHVFTDGPAPTGLRYCINSASIKFEPSEGKVK